MLHIPSLSFDGLVDYSIAKNAIGMALATKEYGSDARSSVVLEHSGEPAKVLKP